jgi:putative Holliday junction resolvase
VKVLALDHGAARTGVAVSDPTGTLARPLPAIARVDTPAGMDALARVVAEEAPEAIVVGEPTLMSGRRGTQARAARAFAGRVRTRFGLPVELLDERLSTAEARRRRDESRGGRRGGPDLDSLAACVLLEAWLRRTPSGADR